MQAPSTPIYLGNRCLSPSESPFATMLCLVMTHPSFKERVNSLLSVFPASIPSSMLIKLGQLAYACLLPDYPQEVRHKLAYEEYCLLQVTGEVTYTHLCEYLIRIAAHLVENIDVRSAIAVIELIESRIVDCFVVDLKDPETKKTKIGISGKLDLIDCEDILKESELPEKHHRKACDLVYF